MSTPTRGLLLHNFSASTVGVYQREGQQRIPFRMTLEVAQRDPALDPFVPDRDFLIGIARKLFGSVFPEPIASSIVGARWHAADYLSFLLSLLGMAARCYLLP